MRVREKKREKYLEGAPEQPSREARRVKAEVKAVTVE